MHPVLTLFWIAAAVTSLIGAVVTIVGLYRAPEGFEDGDGFHYAQPSDTRHSDDLPTHADVPHASGIRLA